MHPHALALQTVTTPPHNVTNLVVKRIRKANMTHHPLLKEGKWPNALRAIDDLIRHHEIPRLDLLLQTANGTERNDAAHTKTSQSGDVGAHWYLVWCVLVGEAVSGEEGDGLVGVLEDGNWGGGRAPWSVDVQGRDWGEAFEVCETCTTDNCDAHWACKKTG